MEKPPPPKSPLDLLYDHSVQESFETFRDAMCEAMLFPRKPILRRFALQRAVETGLKDGLFVEFGVAGGGGIRQFSEILAETGGEITGFDSFAGLEEDWTGHHRGRQRGAFGQDDNPPEIPANAKLVKGLVQDMLPGYLADTKPAPFAFIHMDLDTYTPTAFALGAVKKRLKKGTVILFDELYGYPGWKHHEWKALSETLKENTYRFIGFSREAVAIEMVKAA